MPHRFPMLVLLASLALLLGCAAPSADAPVPEGLDTSFLTSALWDDGQAEIAMYEVTRGHNVYGDIEEEQTFTVGTYVVKHDYAPAEQTKATGVMEGVSAFKSSLFYEFESGSYEYKRNYVVNARQADLRPFKESFTSYDWCSNRYREVAAGPDGQVHTMMRSDDYGNRDASFAYRAGAVTPAQLPLVARGLDFSEADAHTLHVLLDDGTYVETQARLMGEATFDGPEGAVPAEQVQFTYEAPVPSMISDRDVTNETYWRGTGEARLLLKLEGADYTMTLIEQVRSPYWSENVWDRLERVTERP